MYVCIKENNTSSSIQFTILDFQTDTVNGEYVI